MNICSVQNNLNFISSNTEVFQKPKLITASRNGDAQQVEVLLKTEKSVDVRNNDGWTALMEAAKGGHLEVVEQLLLAGAGIDVSTNEGWTALMIAASYGRKDIVHLLIRSGADVNFLNKRQDSPLGVAVMLRELETASALIDAGSSIDCQNSLGWSPLMVAVFQDSAELIELLISRGASPEVLNYCGESALKIAKDGASGRRYRELKPLLQTEATKKLLKVFNTVQKYCHANEVDKAFLYSYNGCNIKISGLGWGGGYISKVMRKDFEEICARNYGIYTNDIQQSVVYAFNRDWNRADLTPEDFADDYLSGKPILISTGYQKHAVALVMYRGLFCLIDRAKGQRTSSLVFSISGEQFETRERLAGYIGSVLALDGAPFDEYWEFFEGEFKKDCYSKTKLDRKLRAALSLSPQTVGNCSWACREGVLISLLHFLQIQEPGRSEDEKIEKLKKIRQKNFLFFTKFLNYQGQKYRFALEGMLGELSESV